MNTPKYVVQQRTAAGAWAGVSHHDSRAAAEVEASLLPEARVRSVEQILMDSLRHVIDRHTPPHTPGGKTVHAMWIGDAEWGSWEEYAPVASLPDNPFGREVAAAIARGHSYGRVRHADTTYYWVTR